ncbi:MAG: hypothetical protein HY074_01160 [Deltaproteobacteria bacterium]|nr:hypothetical protein [Deltaproteobacteria bacterium]
MLSRLLGVLLLALAFLLAWTSGSHAQSGEEYYSRLSLVQKARRSAQLVQGLLTANPVVQRKFYVLGQTWTVQVTHKSDSRGRPPAMSVDPSGSKQESQILYDFKVTAIDAQNRARVEVTVRDALPASPVRHMALIINDQFVVVAREIHYGDGRGMRRIEFGSDANVALGFDAYPIELPDLATAGAELAREVPRAVRPHLRGASERIVDFSFDDLFGRPVRALWADGDGWPLYYENTAFTAVLVKRSGGLP